MTNNGSPVPDGAPHRLVTCRWPSQALSCEKTVTVLVPAAQPTAHDRYPVLVLLHGFGGTRRTWTWRTRLIDYLRGTGLLVVLPESGRRWFINDHAGRRYEDYLIGELLPRIKQAFPVARGRAGWAIGGFSMGGAAALMQALRHPAEFSAVASHAGAFEAPFRVGDPYVGERSRSRTVIPSTEIHERVWGPPESITRQAYDPYALINSWRADQGLRVYADVGCADFDRIIRMNRNTAAALSYAGIPIEYHERRGAHDLEFVNAALPFSLDFVSRALSGRCH